MAEASTGTTTDSAKRCVLIVDSDPQNLIFMSMIVQRFECRPFPALGVGPALEIVHADRPVLIITELRLKGLSGLDLLQRLRQERSTCGIPVVIMTRDLSPEIERQCREEGAVACFKKPIQANALYQAISPIISPASRRKHIRIETLLSVTVNDRPLDCADGECATNLSVNGIYLRTKMPYPENSHILLQLRLNEDEIEAEARVVHCQRPEDGQSGMWGIGLQFTAASPEAGEIIRRFINDQVTHGIEPEI